MQLGVTQARLVMGLIIILVGGLVYLLWKRSAPPEPLVGPGQSIKNPFGSAGMAGGSGGGQPVVMPRTSGGPAPSTGAPFTKEQFGNYLGKTTR
jgi:hypothetical protein